MIFRYIDEWFPAIHSLVHWRKFVKRKRSSIISNQYLKENKFWNFICIHILKTEYCCVLIFFAVIKNCHIYCHIYWLWLYSWLSIHGNVYTLRQAHENSICYTGVFGRLKVTFDTATDVTQQKQYSLNFAALSASISRYSYDHVIFTEVTDIPTNG